MLVVMQSQATDEQVRAVCERIESLGFKALPVPGAGRTAVCITGNSGAVDLGSLESMPGVVECIPVSKPYKLVSRDVKAENTVVRVPTPLGDVAFGGSEVAMVGGPCAIETREQAFTVAKHVKAAGARLFRGGAYKPRTSPYSFQGLGEAGLEIMGEVRKEFGLGIITEAIDNESLDLVEEYADVIQIGARNMQNFSLLEARRPRQEAGAAEARHVRNAGRIPDGRGVLDVRRQLHVILCERGVRTFSDFTRNTLDLAVVPAVQKRSHLPIVVDPSHGTGRRNKVLPLRARLWPWARTGCWWKCITIQTARFPTGRSPSCRRNLSN